MDLSELDIQPQLTRRRPGQSKLTTPRDEKDIVTILSGTENGKTLGTPIGVTVPNANVRPQDYAEMTTVPRPGHADYTYQQKYGIRAASGGGRASARETIGRVAAGAIAEKWLREAHGVEIVAYVSSIGDIVLPVTMDGSDLWSRDSVDTLGTLRILKNAKHWKMHDADEDQVLEDANYETLFVTGQLDALPAYEDMNGIVYNANGDIVDGPADKASLSDDVVPVRCPDPSTAAKMATLIRIVKADQDSIGGTVTCIIRHVPVGLGEPVFDKLEAMLAHAMLSLPATKGFEIGSGFHGATLRGSVHNDRFIGKKNDASNELKTATNFAGGTLGGISSGQEVVFRVAIKPVSTIGKKQETCTFNGEMTALEAKGRHDPCVLPRAVPLVEAMAALVLADALMLQRARAGPL